ncbi:multiple cyclophane-containing RiPP AmcA [Micromonospora sp. NPDC049282]|uniref:multiple cyclophane-containing RiPP AmcA n=1 Tax=Micromonospora sp. NPDC049282 TaxID=3364269 RepID=UPI00371470D6
MTVYLSRNVTMGDPTRDCPAAAQAVRPASVDPPLLTHVWQILFERQTREREAR